MADPAGVVDAGPLPPGDYTLTYTFGSGTCESIDTRSLVVLPRPAINLTASVTALCDGEGSTFTPHVTDGQPPSSLA